MKTILVIGATGGIGGETARALARRGWRVRALARHIPEAREGFDWIVGDALDRAAVIQAAQGADAILHAVNPPGYRDWDTLVLPMIDNSIAAAQSVDARLMLPGTLYNYDPRAMALVAPDAPQRPATRKGAIRVQLEQRIADACDRGMRALIVRFGDFFGPRPGNAWLSQGMIAPGKPVRNVINPGRSGVGHAWAYLPDAAESFARLIEREADLPQCARYHFDGYWDATGTDFAGIVRDMGGGGHVRAFPWWALPLIAPFHPTMRELREMKLFWRHSLRLDNRTLVAMLGEEPRTPIGDAVRDTLIGLDCLPVEKRG